MRKKITTLTMKTIFSMILFDQSLSALTLSGTEVNFKSVDNSDKKLRVLSHGHKTIIAKFDTPLTKNRIDQFYNSGVESIVYAGDLSYYFYAQRSVLNGLDFSNSDFVAKIDMKSQYRVSKDSSGLVTLGYGDYQKYNLLFLVEMTREDVKSYFKENDIDAKILKILPELKEVKIEVASKDLNKLKNLHLIQYMDRSHNMVTVSGKKSNRNITTANNSNISDLWGGSYNLNGENIEIGVVDGGVVRETHQEFNANGIKRVYNRSNLDTNFHATHVTGTIIAEGDRDSARGMANKATVYSYGFEDVSFEEAILDLYKYDNVLLSNHSYGYSEKSKLAEYDSTAASQDKAVSNNPFLNVFEAAGNDGEDQSYGDFGIIKGPGNSKNIFTIGALNINSSGVADISSTGPVKDGRIKPDLCIRGEYITSTTDESDDSYAIMSGTSMATPAATGAAALILQQYKRTTGGFDIRHDTLKSIMINTAVDKENKGPDYKVGFGMIDAKAAVDVVKTIGSNRPLVNLDSISHNGVKVYNFTLEGSKKFKTTISWVDQSANPANATTLVNDIDMTLVNRDTGKIYYPYTLDKYSPNAPAVTNKANKVDNIEQIEIDNLAGGNYQLVIKGSKIISPNQEFAVVSNSKIFAKGSIETLKPSKLINFAKTIYSEIL
jgi:subtilisin family serine protease